MRLGSPAHAGMDPKRAAVLDFLFRLPRARGDGPRPQSACPWPSGAPPRTRGWTPRVPSTRPQRHGSPAHAGMDPEWGFRRLDLRRLPRARGDGPQGSRPAAHRGEAPPRTRGWTQTAGPQPPSLPGSPAHAGMDPPCHLARIALRGLPRARGDGPGPMTPSCMSIQAPPRTRGWTRRGVAPDVRVWGSPAHAGMDRTSRCRFLLWRGLPRARGDGPSSYPSSGS